MNTLETRGIAAALLLSPLLFGCASRQAAESVTVTPTPVPAGSAPATSAPAAPVAAMPAEHQHMEGMAGMGGMAGMAGMAMPTTIPKGALYTAADVAFMQGMIAHHAQAIYMSRLAAARGANPRVLKFANKIDQSQWAEIRLMQEWLRANNQVAPDTSSWRTMSMPGMLTAAQLAQLTAAKGTDFDRQFLTLMIQHHQGALKMVDDLLATPLAAQDVDVSVFANDVVTVQTAEIAIMQQMLVDL